jgi:Phasin protein
MTKRRTSNVAGNKPRKATKTKVAARRESAAITLNNETHSRGEKANRGGREEILRSENKAVSEDIGEASSQPPTSRNVKRAPQLGPKTGPKVAATEASGVHRKVSDKERPRQPEATRMDLADRLVQRSNSRHEEPSQAQPRTPADERMTRETRSLVVSEADKLSDPSSKLFEALTQGFDRSLGTAGQAALGLQFKLMEFTARSITGGFEHALKVAGARNFAEVMELQTAYWQRQFDDFAAQIEEIRSLLTLGTRRESRKSSRST